MINKIYVRLSLIALIAIIATSIGVTVVYYSLFQGRVEGDLRQNARLLMETDVLQKAYESDEDIETALNKLCSDELRITWIDKDGTVLFDNDTVASSLSNHMDRPEIQAAFVNGEGESNRKSDTQNMNTFYYALLLENGTVLRVSTQARAISSIILSVLPVIGFIVVIILLICMLIGRYLVKQIMKPIYAMAENLDDTDGYCDYKELEPFAKKIRSQHENILAAAKSRQDFTASVTHELKTPITAISGYAELIENHMVTEDSEIHAAQEIRRNAERLHSLVSDIIQLSELDHNELPRKFENINLYQVAKSCSEEYRHMASLKGITFSCSGGDAFLQADAALIYEMIGNLLQNAIRYNREKGSVSVFVSSDDGHPLLSVMDTGIGIPAESQDRIFERFYRVDKSRSRETGGTGLGLAIVKHIADIHMAEIELNSTLGQGTTITIRF